MLDINGVKIEVGQTVKTQQPDGGLFAPPPSTTGEVVMQVSSNDEEQLFVKYSKPYFKFDTFILLEGKINEVIKKRLKTETTSNKVN